MTKGFSYPVDMYRTPTLELKRANALINYRNTLRPTNTQQRILSGISISVKRIIGRLLIGVTGNFGGIRWRGVE
jgi:hypothetical protein